MLVNRPSRGAYGYLFGTTAYYNRYKSVGCVAFVTYESRRAERLEAAGARTWTQELSNEGHYPSGDLFGD